MADGSTQFDVAPIPPDEVQRRGRLVLRTLLLLLIPVAVGIGVGALLRFSAILPLPEGIPHGERRFNVLITIVVVVLFLTAVITLVRVGRPTLSALLLVGAWTLVTTLASLQYGVETIWPALLIMPICAAGLLIDGAASISLAALGTILVGALAVLEMSGVKYPKDPLPAFLMVQLPILSSAFWIGLFWMVAGLTWLLARDLQRALHQSRAQAVALGRLSAQLETRVNEQTAQLAQRTARAEALYGVARALASTRDLEQVLALIAEQAARLLRFEAAAVLLVEPGDGLRLMSGYRQPEWLAGSLGQCEATLRKALAAGRVEVISLAGAGGPAGKGALALSLPLRYGAEVAGVLLLLDAENRPERGRDELAVAEGLADAAAVAIANAQFLAQSREAGVLEERTRLARDIHDTLAQGLTGVVVQLGAAQRALDAAPEEALEHIALAQSMARESLAEARRSVWNLRAGALERGDLGDALRKLVAQPAPASPREAGPETRTTFDQRGEPWPLSPAAESALLRVAQEALANAARHARAARVDVVLEYTPEAVRLAVCDDGVGLDAAALARARAPGPSGGFGLLGMRERIAGLGGTLELAGEAGTRIVATIPKGSPGVEESGSQGVGRAGDDRTGDPNDCEAP